MSKLKQFFFPPLFWQEFEDLTASMAEHVFHTKMVDKIGRPGQAQHGIDVYVAADGKGYGIQCKRRSELDENGDPRPGGAINEAGIRNALNEARNFPRQLDVFILATTAQRERDLQHLAHEISTERRATGLSALKLWFWDDYVSALNLYDPLERIYYDNILQIRSVEDQDRKVVDLLTRAFHRPAFEDSIATERGDAFEQALEDTVHALNNGTLVDRRTRQVFQRTYGGREGVENDQWRAQLDALYKCVAQVRENYAVAVKWGRIKNRRGILDVIDPHYGQLLDDLRRECLDKARRLRIDAGLKPL